MNFRHDLDSFPMKNSLHQTTRELCDDWLTTHSIRLTAAKRLLLTHSALVKQGAASPTVTRHSTSLTAQIVAWTSSLLVCRQSAPADKSLPLARSQMAHLFFKRCKSATHGAESFVLCIDLFFLCFDLPLLQFDLILLLFE